MKSQTIKGVEHFVFEDRIEFLSHFSGFGRDVPLLSKDWRLAQKGHWVVADDGGVVEILKRGHLKGLQGGDYVRTIVGTFMCKQDVVMDTDFSLHPSRYTFSKKNMDNYARIKARERCTIKERRFIMELIKGSSLTEGYKAAFGQPDMSYEKAKRKANVLMKQERIMSEFRKEIERAATKHGVDANYIISNYKHMVDTLRDPENAPTRKTALDSLAKMLGAFEKPKDDDKEVGYQGFQGFDEADFSDIENEQLTEPAMQLEEPTKEEEVLKEVFESKDITVMQEIDEDDGIIF